MSGHTRRAAPVACHHCPDMRDCGECRARAHVRAVATAEVRELVAPDESKKIAKAARLDAEAARDGHRLLHANGIRVFVVGLAFWRAPCLACGQIGEVGALCRNPRCPGRRVRCELPEVRR